MTAPLPPYQPGSPAWQAGYEHAKRQAAEWCRERAAVWEAELLPQRQLATLICKDAILAMRPSPPRVSPGMEPTPYSAPTHVAAAGGGAAPEQDVQALYEAQRAKARAATLAAYAAAGAKG